MIHGLDGIFRSPLGGPRAWVWPFAPPPGVQRRTWMRVSHGRGAWIDGSGAFWGRNGGGGGLTWGYPSFMISWKISRNGMITGVFASTLEATYFWWKKMGLEWGRTGGLMMFNGTWYNGEYHGMTIVKTWLAGNCFTFGNHTVTWENINFTPVLSNVIKTWWVFPIG